MKTWKTITITALTTLALTIGGIFIYTNTQTSHDNVETLLHLLVKLKKVVVLLLVQRKKVLHLQLVQLQNLHQ